MSLLDAMLLEGYRDPREVYIALCTDGQKGSGTMDDPYDGGTRLGLALEAEITCNRREFAVALLGHGLSEVTSIEGLRIGVWKRIRAVLSGTSVR